MRVSTILLIGCLALASTPAAAQQTGAIANQQDALNWWIERAETGTPQMKHGLAQIYATGNPALGVRPDLRQAAGWYQRAADEGHAASQYALAAAYEEGLGVERNVQLALSWYRRAAGQGHAAARERLRALTAPPPAPGD